jgi:hypothetical protein
VGEHPSLVLLRYIILQDKEKITPFLESTTLLRWYLSEKTEPALTLNLLSTIKETVA